MQPLVFEPPPGDDAPACVAYCAGAALEGCPRDGDCLAACAPDRALKPGCEDELDDFLDCAKSRVRDDTCGLNMPANDEPIEGPYDCLGRLELWESCDSDVPRETHLAEVCDFRQGRATCPLGPVPVEIRDRCHEGECECLMDDQVVARCTATIATAPLDGCCWPIFADLLLD